MTATHWKIVAHAQPVPWRRTSTLDVQVCQNMDAAGRGTEVEGTEVRVCMRASFG